MGIQDWSEDTILVDLSAEPHMGMEILEVTKMAEERNGCDVVIDFSAVDIITSSSLSKLLNLRKTLTEDDRKLILCSVAPATKGIFMVSGLDGFFEFADDKSDVLASL